MVLAVKVVFDIFEMNCCI